jgi:hypothetical protein
MNRNLGLYAMLAAVLTVAIRGGGSSAEPGAAPGVTLIGLQVPIRVS